MKPYKVVLFIFSVLAGLALLCIVFPKEGIALGSVRLEFPSLTEVLSSPTQEAPQEDDEEEKKMQARLDSIKNMKDKEFVDYIKKSDTRFFMPKDDLGYLDDLFKAMENADKKAVRIMHYGDSQIEEDHLSCDLREHLQELFGGGGVGMQPAVQLVPKETVVQATSPESLERRCVYGAPEWRGSNSNYGPMGQASHVSGNASFTFTASNAKKFPHAGKINKVMVAMAGSGSMTAVAGGKTYTLKTEQTGEGVRVFSAVLDSAVNRVKVNVNGNMQLYGISMENTKGVIVDNIPMRGCSGTVFTGIKEQSFAPFFKQQDVRLVILQFGGNSVSLDMGKTAIEKYCESLRNQIKHFKACAPHAKILFIGPADMATSIRGEMRSYPCMKELVVKMREMCNAEGCAFWDMYTVMGGDGSIVKWTKAKPALAYTDYIHFTPRGAHKMGEMLSNTMKMYYDYYKFRTHEKD